MKPILTIGMATFDDYDGVYFTAQSIRLHHPEITAEAEILVVDNHPDGPCAEELKSLQNWIPGYRYFSWNRSSGTSIRDIIFREAHGKYVLCIDSHVLFPSGSLRKLIDYFRAHPKTRDLLQGPLLYDDHRSISSHMDPRWSAGMFGIWGTDPRAADPAAEPFEIGMQGLGAFACRRAAWPGFNPRLTGFGSEEGYIQEKFRQAGGRTLCLPFLRWMHRFGRPLGVRYRNEWEDRIRNYMIVARELGRDPSDTIQHFRDFIGADAANHILASVTAQLDSPFNFFDAIYCINLDLAADRWRSVMARFETLGIASRIRRFSAIATPSNRHIGCALSHRAIVDEAQRHGLRNVLVFEDDVVFTRDARSHLQTALRELEGRDWGLLYLGAWRWEHKFPMAEGCTRLEQVGPVTTCHAIAYHESAYQRLLEEIPSDPAAVETWLQFHKGIDQYFASVIRERKFLVSPVIATQENLLAYEPADVRERVHA